MQDNLNPSDLPREQLELEYEQSQWALTWALHKLGGSMTVTPEEMQEFNKQVRIWYQGVPSEHGTIITIELKEFEEPSCILIRN